jgi:hypothetical protein
VDANAAWYAETGLAADKVFEGKELVLEAGFHLGYELKAGWGAIKTKGRLGKDFDKGEHFKPPFGNNCAKSGGRCGVELWIPPDVTQTGIRIGSKQLHVGGGAHVGFLLAGSGSAAIKYQSLSGNEPPQSRRTDAKGVAVSHTLRFDSGRPITMATTLAPLDKPGSRNYGFRLSEPSYRWALRIIPGLKVEIDIKAGRFLDRTFGTGALWLDSLGIDLGTVALGRHGGTVGQHGLRDGVRTWQTSRK